jgi:hypothetical protein
MRAGTHHKPETIALLRRLKLGRKRSAFAVAMVQWGKWQTRRIRHAESRLPYGPFYPIEPDEDGFPDSAMPSNGDPPLPKT